MQNMIVKFFLFCLLFVIQIHFVVAQVKKDFLTSVVQSYVTSESNYRYNFTYK